LFASEQALMVSDWLTDPVPVFNHPYTAEALYPSITYFVFEFDVAVLSSTAWTYQVLLMPLL
jgi:hypothetical protein